MADMTLWGVTYSDVLQKLRGVAVADCSEAGTAPTGQTAIENHMKRAMSWIKSGLSEKYRRMLTHVDGQVFWRCASGRTSFTLSITAASNPVVYVNYNKAWDVRHISDAEDSDGVSITSSVVTLATSITEDDWVVIEYDTDGTGIVPSANTSDYTLQDLLLNRSAFTLGREVLMKTGDGSIEGFIQDYRDESDKLLAELSEGHRGIPVLDDVVLYEDWRIQPKGGARNVRAVRG